MKRISIQKVLWLIIICDTVEKQNVFVMWESKEVNLKNCPKFHDLTYVLFHDLKKKNTDSEVFIFAFGIYEAAKFNL